MVRCIVFFVLVLTMIASIDTVEVLAGSSKNPFSGYNISGINYGSQQWDREHGKGASSHQSGRVRYRRR